jgi:hypothetical protein
VIRAHQPGSEPIDISGDDSQPGCGNQANTYSDRARSQGASSDPGEGSLARRQRARWRQHLSSRRIH